MSNRLKKTDVVIIGLGAAGSYAALPLARAGVDVVALEAGPRLGPEDFPMDEVRNDIRNAMGAPKVQKEIPTWRPDTKTPASQTAGVRIYMMNGVGGSSTHYTMQQWRFLPWNFKVRSETIKRYGHGAIPAGSTVADWPIDYSDLEPYYQNVEFDMGVSGHAGVVRGKKIKGGNPYEASRNTGYPLPPLRRSGWTQLTEGAASRLGWHPFPGPAAIRSRPYKGLPSCQYCGFCTYNGCMVAAKGSTMWVAIPEAEKTKHLKVVPNSRVTEIKVGPDGRATGVEFVRGGRTYFQPADVVILSTYVYENTRLLLLSKSKAFPHGLSNNSRQVGRNYMAHSYPGANGFFPGKQLNLFSGPGAQSTFLDDFNGDNFDHKGLGFIGGAVVGASMENKPISQGRTTPPSVPSFGTQWKQWLKAHGNSVGTVGASGFETLPYDDNFLDLDPKVKDAWGRPVIRITFDLKENEKRLGAYIIEKEERWLKEAGASETWSSGVVPIPINSHAYGGTRMGNDPRTSVVDEWLLSHEVPNLAILGGSTFPTAAGYNPTGTIEALAWRTGEHIAKNWSQLTT